jgi:phospholipid transport system substrate-binding protein
MIRRLGILMLLSLVLPTLAAAADRPSVPGPGPQDIIEQSARQMLDALDSDRDAYRKDPKKVNSLVDKIILPHFDTQLAAQLVLGKYWRTATADQRQRFIDAFYHSLLNKYGAALASFTSKNLVMLPFQGDLSSGNATVRTQVKLDDGTQVPVNYSMRATADGWKAWDVTIEGISYIKSFKTDVGSEVEQKGLDAVIQRLETEAGVAQHDAA